MKYIISILIIQLFSFSLLAQDYDFTVSESKMVLGGGLNNTLSVKIYESNEKDIIKDWKNILKKNDAKVDIGKEIVANNVLLKDLSDLPFNCFSSLKSLEKDVYQLNVCVYLGGNYLSFNEHPAKYKVFADFLSEFAKATSIQSLDNLVKMAKQELSKKESDLAKLKDTKEKLESEIAGWKKDIQKAEDDIEINIIEQEDKKNEVQVAKEVLKKEKGKLDQVRKSK